MSKKPELTIDDHIAIGRDYLEQVRSGKFDAGQAYGDGLRLFLEASIRALEWERDHPDPA